MKNTIRTIIVLLSFSMIVGCARRNHGSKTGTDSIRVKSPSPDETISSPVTLIGQARGTWYFEGDFPVRLVSDSGNVIARSHLTAQSKWMTEDWVPFRGTIHFDQSPEVTRGRLQFKSANPSGKPEHQKSYEIPIRF